MANVSIVRSILSRVPEWLLATPAASRTELIRAQDGPLVIAGLFRTASGIGQAARACADALIRLGLKVKNVDLSDLFNQTDLSAAHPLSAMPSTISGTLILNLNPPEVKSALKALRLFHPRKWRVIGAWAWELETVPAEWFPVSRHFTEIWVPSTFVMAAFAPFMKIPVKVVPHYINIPNDISSKRAEYGFADNEVVVLSMADGRSSFDRKNLIGSINVFKAALGERTNCRLVLKTRNLNNFASHARALKNEEQNHPRITIINGSLSYIDLLCLIDSCDIFLSLHRAEGFGLPLAEAMALGKTVISTGWSGNMDFMSADSVALVPYTLGPGVDTSGVYKLGSGSRWAEPNESAAIECLRSLVDNPNRRHELGAAARAAIKKKLIAENYLSALRAC